MQDALVQPVYDISGFRSSKVKVMYCGLLDFDIV